MSLPKKVLFVCNQNRYRSRTAEDLCRHSPTIEAKSAGIDTDAVVPLSADHIIWADTICVFESRQLNRIRKKYKGILSDKRLLCLDIPDEFEYMDPVLVNELKGKLSILLGADPKP